MGKWKIWADTGGTFTDCIATSPTNEVKRIKILSNSALRGSIEEVETAETFKAKVNWHTKKNIFNGYSLIFSDFPEEQFEIKTASTAEGAISLSKPPDFEIKPAMQFSITAFEEAPVMAARIATETTLHEQLPKMQMRIGSTKGTNALLERKGAPTALLTTKGFRDIMVIGDQTRSNIFSLKVDKTPPLHEKVLEIDERLSADGQILNPLSQNEIAPVVNAIKEAGIDTVAISFMHSYLNDEHEKKLKQYLSAFGIGHLSTSAELEPSIDFLARTNTALINAYLAPVIEDYIDKIAAKVPDTDLRIMTSAGGLNGSKYFRPKDSLLSGPAGGVVGAAAIARSAKQEKIITLDMGGTSTDVSRYAGEYDYQFETEIDGNRLMAPSLAIRTVAAGGGSICQYDGYKFTVGPESASAFPGPACYGNHGPLTITDVNLLLGRIDTTSFGIPLSKEASEKALLTLLDEEEQHQEREVVLAGFLQIANEKMAEAIRKISISKGYDPTEYALLAFGGAGGQHVCSVAKLLNIEKVIVPYDAGLLSAYGMGQAKIERFATKEILKPYHEVSELDGIIQKLSNNAASQLYEEGFEKDGIEIRKVYLYLRYQGQNYSLEVSYKKGTDPLPVFKEKYEQLYGYLPEEGIPELVTIKVIASSKEEASAESTQELKSYVPQYTRQIDCFLADQWQSTPVYEWESLKAGAKIEGPALLVSQNSTVIIESNWQLMIDANNTAVLQLEEAQKKRQANEQSKNEAVSLELFTNRFKAVAEEMGALLQRTALSVNIKERLDFSCALLDKEGYLVVNAPHIPVHLGSMGLCIRKTVQAISIEEGDVVITNHPAYGGSHLPDITLIAGVFNQKKQLIGYVANRAHHAEIGGIAPGSFPAKAKNLEEEGVVIHPTHIVKDHQVQWPIIKKLFTDCQYPSRSVKENLADLNAGLASIAAGKKALTQLVQQFGSDKVTYYMQELNKYTASLMAGKLQTLQKQTYQATELLDDGSPIQVKIEEQQGKWHIDFSGTAKVHPQNLNATEAITRSVIIYVLRLLLNKDIPLNEGLMSQVELVLPTCLLNPNFVDDPANCPAVAGGNTESSQRLTDTLLKAFGMAACSQGTMNNLLFGNENFGYYETIGGGVGAGPDFHGASAVHQHMTNTRITDAEIMEMRYPVRVERFYIRKNSGGSGKYRGGHGIERQISFLTAVELTLLSQHRKTRPYGLKGGEAGGVGEQFVVYSNGSKEAISGIITLKLRSGDKISIFTPGGGGFGKATH